jgi:FeS assembly SUF system protein
MAESAADQEQQPATDRPAGAPTLDADGREALRAGVIDALHTVYDPEIPVDIYELGLIYDIDVDPAGNVAIKMTLTAPGCPVAGSMPDMVKDAVGTIESIGNIDVELVWDPPWDRSRMSETAQLALGMI